MIPDIEKKALSKCIVYFYDGNCRTFYSYDRKHKNSVPDKSLGIKRLEKMLLESFKNRWETAIIYDNRENGEELAKFKRGVRIS